MILKFCILRAEILAKNKAENAKYVQNRKWWAHEWRIFFLWNEFYVFNVSVYASDFEF